MSNNPSEHVDPHVEAAEVEIDRLTRAVPGLRAWLAAQDWTAPDHAAVTKAVLARFDAITRAERCVWGAEQDELLAGLVVDCLDEGGPDILIDWLDDLFAPSFRALAAEAGMSVGEYTSDERGAGWA